MTMTASGAAPARQLFRPFPVDQVHASRAHTSSLNGAKWWKVDVRQTPKGLAIT
jgi:hypothetical protein